MTAYTPDKGLETKALSIIEVNYPLLKMLKIAYVFREEAPISDGKVTCGMAVRVDDRNWSLHKFDAMIEIGKDVWDEAEEDFKNALMDHELAHIGIRLDEDGQPAMDEKTGRLKVFMRKHDIEEFEEVLERHGAYHKGLRDFLVAFGKSKDSAKKSKKDDLVD